MHYLKYNKTSTYSNRGMSLESDINVSNEYYKDKEIALIYKKPTPIKPIKVIYNTGKITEAYFETQSTLDYNGVYKGKYIEFDAKETTSKTSFPLSNIHPHQLEHIKNVIKHQGIAFLIVRFTTLNEDYLIMGDTLLDYINNNERKSIPYDFFKNNTYKLQIKYTPRIDYIKVIESLVENEKT